VTPRPNPNGGIHPAAPAAPRPMQAPQPARPMQAPQPAARPLHAPQVHAPGAVAAPPPLPGQSLPRPGNAPTMNPAARKPVPAEEEAISLVEDDEPVGADALAHATPTSKIKFGAELGHKKHDFTRQLKQGGLGACRVRTFHAKLSDQGLEYLDDAINVWLDHHPEIDVKFVQSNIGMFDGKFKDLALIVNVWY
jgi:hypothetical protein